MNIKQRRAQWLMGCMASAVALAAEGDEQGALDILTDVSNDANLDEVLSDTMDVIEGDDLGVDEFDEEADGDELDDEYIDDEDIALSSVRRGRSRSTARALNRVRAWAGVDCDDDEFDEEADGDDDFVDSIDDMEDMPPVTASSRSRRGVRTSASTRRIRGLL